MANNTARLGDLATYVNGYAFKPSDWGDTGLPIIRIQDLTGNSYQLNRYDGDYPARIEVNDGDVLISWSASLGVYVWQRGKALLNQHIFKVVFDKLPINKDYFVFAVEHKLAEMESKTHGATMKHIVKKDFDSTTIPYPAIEEQAEIAERLRRITALIEKQKEQLLLLDQLVKSRFIELFGDPVANSFGWKQALLCEVTSKIGSGATPRGGKESYQAEGITLIRSMNVHDGRFEYKDLAHVTDEQAAQLDNVTVEDGDVFINITGASVARSCIVPTDILPARVNQHVAIIRCVREWLHPRFANNMFLNDRFKGQLLDIGESGGATRQAITKQQLENLAVILPPIALQEQFAAFVEQTDKSKLAVQKGLQELEILKKSLMQQYFG